jgi:hypothetical protein
MQTKFPEQFEVYGKVFNNKKTSGRMSAYSLEPKTE